VLWFSLGKSQVLEREQSPEEPLHISIFERPGQSLSISTRVSSNQDSELPSTSGDDKKRLLAVHLKEVPQPATKRCFAHEALIISTPELIDLDFVA
jgi:hypothetical protein